MNEDPKFPWDYYSDQPKILKKSVKRELYKKAVGQYLKSALLMPLVPFFYGFTRFRKQTVGGDVSKVLGLAVHLELPCEGKTIVPLEELRGMVDELGVRHLMVRIQLADVDRIEEYVRHIEALSADGREIVVTLLQSRVLLDDLVQLEQTLEKTICAIKGKVHHIQVGTAYNRRKWGLYHYGEYHGFFQLVRKVCDRYAPEMKLIGGAVIDFEIPPFMESLFHFRKGRYDGYGSHLYVDRRGAPENEQGGLNFLGKVNFIDSLIKSSWNTENELWITEINWPLKDTGAFAPCKGSVLVDEEAHADYLARMYLLAMASGRVRTCYWHQLVAPGYGMVDNRDVSFRKRPAYAAFKTLVRLFSDARVDQFHNGNYKGIEGVYAVELDAIIEGNRVKVIAIWSNSGEHSVEGVVADQWVTRDGETLDVGGGSIQIGAGVIYGISS